MARRSAPGTAGEADRLRLAGIRQRLAGQALPRFLQLGVQLHHQLVHAGDPLRRPLLRGNPGTAEHHDHVLHRVTPSVLASKPGARTMVGPGTLFWTSLPKILPWA